MQLKFPRRFFSRLSACGVTLLLLGASLLQAAEFKPFLTVQFAGPGTLLSIAEKMGPLLDLPDEAFADMAPFKELPGVNPAGHFGLALSANRDSALGVDVILMLPISDFAAFNIPGMESEVAGIRAMFMRQGNRYTFFTPMGNLIAQQQTGYLIISTEDVAPFAATADPKDLFAEMDEFTLGIHINRENITEEQLARIWGTISILLIATGMEVPDLEDLLEPLGPLAENLEDIAAVTVGITFDPQTLNLSGVLKSTAKTGTELADKYAHSKGALAKTVLGAFLTDTPNTVLAWHYLDYFTDTEIEMLSNMWEEIADGLMEGLYDALEEEVDNEQLAQFIAAVEALLEYMNEVIEFYAEERLFDWAYWLDSEGTFIAAIATEKTADIVALDEKFYGTLLNIFEEDGFKAFIEGKMRRNYETVAGYSLSCIPNILADLPMDLPEEIEEMLTNISLSLFWGVKEGEALVYAIGLDFAKAEQTVKAALTRTQTPTPPKQTAVFALKPFTEFFLHTFLPLLPEVDEEELQEMTATMAPLLNASANAKIVYTEEYLGTALSRKIDINGTFITACIEMYTEMMKAMERQMEEWMREWEEWEMEWEMETQPVRIQMQR